MALRTVEGKKKVLHTGNRNIKQSGSTANSSPPGQSRSFIRRDDSVPVVASTVKRKSAKEALKLFTCAYHGTRRFVVVCGPVNEIEEGTDEIPGNGERV